MKPRRFRFVPFLLLLALTIVLLLPRDAFAACRLLA